MYSRVLTKKTTTIFIGAKANKPENVELRANSRENTKHTTFVIH